MSLLIKKKSENKPASEIEVKKVEPKTEVKKKKSSKTVSKLDKPKVVKPATSNKMKRLNGTILMEAIIKKAAEMDTEGKKGLGVLAAVIQRNSNKSASVCDRIIEVILELQDKGYEL